MSGRPQIPAPRLPQTRPGPAGAFKSLTGGIEPTLRTQHSSLHHTDDASAPGDDNDDGGCTAGRTRLAHSLATFALVLRRSETPSPRRTMRSGAPERDVHARMP